MPHPDPSAPGMPGIKEPSGGGNKPPNPYDQNAPDRNVVDNSRTRISGGYIEYFNRYGELLYSRPYREGEGGGGGGGARGATPEELALSYAKLEQDQRQWEAELLAAQAKGDADRAQRAQEHLDNLAAEREALDRRYADAQAQREWQGRENEFDRNFQQARDEARYEFEGAEAEKDRALQQFMQDDQQAFLGGENAADRSLRLQLQANELGFSREELAFEKERFAATHALNKARFGLEAARQFADVISSTDPAALDAFLAAGGGNISNALAGGQTALSENALLPAAMTLRTARQMGAPVGAGLEGAGLYGAGARAGGGGYAPGGGGRPAPSYGGGAGATAPIVYPSAPSASDFMAQRAAANASLGSSPVPTAPIAAGTVIQPGIKELYEGGDYVPKRFIPAQGGFEGIVDRPTTFLTGEGGRPERVQVQPLARGAPQGAATGAPGPPIPITGRAALTDVVRPEVRARTADLQARQAAAAERLRQMLQQAAGNGGGAEFAYAGGPNPWFSQLNGEFQPGPLLKPQIAATTQQPQPIGLEGLYQRQPWEWALGQLYDQGAGQPIYAQRGVRTTVNQPTPVVAGEAYQPERVSIQPVGAGPTQGDGLPSLLGQYRPEMEEVRRLREGVQFGNINTFDVKSRLIDPVLWERFLRGRQAKYGIPVRSQVHEINRYQLAGTTRGRQQGY